MDLSDYQFKALSQNASKTFLANRNMLNKLSFIERKPCAYPKISDLMEKTQNPNFFESGPELVLPRAKTLQERLNSQKKLDTFEFAAFLKSPYMPRMHVYFILM